MIEIIASIAISVFTILFAAFKIIEIKNLEKNGMHTEGTVFSSEFSGTLAGANRYPIIRFKDVDGNWITHPSKTGLFLNFYKIGSTVKIAYETNKPSNFILLDKYTYFIPTVIIFISSVILIFCLFALLEI